MRIAAATALPAVLLSALLAACDDQGPCDEYVSYMCDCHPDSADCEDLRITYEDASTDLEDECAIALDDQEEADAASGHECGGDDTGA